jgi:hypothetical protein
MSILAKRLLTTVGAAAAAIVLSAAPSLADADTTYTADTRASGDYLAQVGTMWFYSEGELFRACDNWSDGAGVIGYWKVGSGGTVHSVYNGGGIGTCKDSDQEIAESATVYIKACLRDDGDVKEGTCSSWEKAYADGIP